MYVVEIKVLSYTTVDHSIGWLPEEMQTIGMHNISKGKFIFDAVHYNVELLKLSCGIYNDWF